MWSDCTNKVRLYVIQRLRTQTYRGDFITVAPMETISELSQTERLIHTQNGHNMAPYEGQRRTI